MELEEVWKDIKEFEGLYQASNLGRIRSLNYKRTGKTRILSQAKQRNGYMLVILAKNGKKKGFNVHRLIANTFIPNSQDKSQVNHINGNKTDNRIKKWESMTQASKETNIAQGDISKCCIGKRKSAGNYIWLNDDGLLNHLTKQDKMIELMAEYIAKIDNDTEICQYENECDENCNRCVKQYFEKKVEE